MTNLHFHHHVGVLEESGEQRRDGLPHLASSRHTAQATTTSVVFLSPVPTVWMRESVVYSYHKTDRHRKRERERERAREKESLLESPSGRS
jgi:hypothetical protein